MVNSGGSSARAFAPATLDTTVKAGRLPEIRINGKQAIGLTMPTFSLHRLINPSLMASYYLAPPQLHTKEPRVMDYPNIQATLKIHRRIK
jgi:hypothetical protein